MRALRLASAAIIFMATPSALAGFELPRQPRYHVNDYARVLSQPELDALEERFVAFERRTGHQTAVAIFPSTDGAPIEQVAADLFKLWGLGSRKGNDGILLVLALKEHGVRIEVGYGLEARLPDARAGRIIRDDLFPRLRERQFASAITAFSQRIDELFSEGEAPAPARDRVNLLVVLLPFLIVFLVAWLGSSRVSGRSLSSRGAYRRNNWWWWGGPGSGGFGGGTFSGGGGGGFGGWSGGGGSSGGGGASGQW